VCSSLVEDSLCFVGDGGLKGFLVGNYGLWGKVVHKCLDERVQRLCGRGFLVVLMGVCNGFVGVGCVIFLTERYYCFVVTVV
jgi:hypothetical protein